MFELMLMRHAKSDWTNRCADIERPLNTRGREDARRMGRYLNEQKLVPHRMVVSAARRTQETAELLLGSLPVAKNAIIIDRELYLADADNLCQMIELYAGEGMRLLLLAHNPGMDDLVCHLAGSTPPLSNSGKLMSTCAVAGFSLDSTADLKKPGLAQLQYLYRPAEIDGDLA